MKLCNRYLQSDAGQVSIADGLSEEQVKPMRRSLTSSLAIAAMGFASTASAQDLSATYSFYGTPGLLEMPTAQSAPEHDLAATYGYTDTLSRTTLSFQLTKRLSGSFRLTYADVLNDPVGTGVEREFDRGFDLQYRFNNESTYLPAFAIGLRDIITPGRAGAEYIVASKSFGDNLILTAGLGWGALGTRDGFDNPLDGDFATRPAYDPADPSGQLTSDQWFRGDAAFFGGAEYQINDTWGVKVEYSSAAYAAAAGAVSMPVDSPYNVGVTYRPRPGLQLGLAYLYGNQLGVTGSFALNPNNRPAAAGSEKAPVPIKARIGSALAAQSWDRASISEPALRDALSTLMLNERIFLTGLEVTDSTARVRFVNNGYRSEAQAIGRIARIMTHVMPDSVTTFILEGERRGIPVSAVTISRRDLEIFENQIGGTDALFARSGFGDAGSDAGLTVPADESARFAWGLGPYFRLNPFSADGDVDVNFGLSLQANYRIQPNLVLSGAIDQSLLKAEPDSTGVDRTPDIQNVRSDGSNYGNDGHPVLQRLSLTYFGRPAENLYSRVSFGYLEHMFGGVSGEVLWKPVESPLGLGLELNQVAQRDSDMLFGFDEYGYDVTTGHLSAYYDLGNGYHTQVDMGRYLAGDWGATVKVDREFDNGWVIGAYVTQTDMDYADFGNGSYNKGVEISIPQDFFTGTASRGGYATAFSTRTGDGGARLQVDGRLYDVVREGHKSDLSSGWGRFWR